MTDTALQKSNPSVPSQITGTWDGARQWLNAAGLMEQSKLFCQVMAGFELISLHKNVTHGGDHRSSSQNGNLKNANEIDVSQNGKGLTWDEILEKETNLSTSTAYRFMDMAKAAAPRLKKIVALRDFDPMSKPMNLLTAPQKNALATGVKKLTDGKTQKDFAEQLGLWKKPSGNASPTPGSRRKLSIGEQAELLKTLAVEDWRAIVELLGAYRGKFTVLKDDTIEAQIAVLERHLKARKAWLNQPKTNRVASAIEDLFDSKS